MSDPDPIGALNQVLNEVLDVVQDVKQAHRKVSETLALHDELDRLFQDLGTWAELLVAEDEALGVSPLSQVQSAAGRLPANLWAGLPSEDEVRTAVARHLERLGERLAVALAQAPDEGFRAAVVSVQAGVAAHLDALRT